MRTFEKILCPVDFSQNSVKALQWTEYLAKKYRSSVIVLHVMELYPAAGFGGDIGMDYERYHAAVASNLTEFTAPLKIKYEKMISTGTPAHKIAALASGLQAGMIVMGTRGELGSVHKLLGSTTEAVMRTSTVPVLTISPNCLPPSRKEDHHVLVPIASLYRPPKGFIRLRRIIRDLQCDPTFLHVVDFHDEMFDASFAANPFLVTTYETKEKSEQLARIGRLIQKNGNNATALIQFGSVSTEIIKEVEANHYDYVLVGVRKKNLLNRFVETNAYKVISQSPAPVITVKVE